MSPTITKAWFILILTNKKLSNLGIDHVLYNANNFAIPNAHCWLHIL